MNVIMHKYFQIIIIVFINNGIQSEEKRVYGRGHFCFSLFSLSCYQKLVFFCLPSSVTSILGGYKKFQNHLASFHHPCAQHTASPVEGMVELTGKCMSSPSRHSHAAVFLRSIYILLQCFFHHRMENMCNRNIKQFHLPKSQLQPEKQREVIKDCSFHFKCTGLPTLIPAVNRKWFAKKQIATLNTYKKHLEWSILLTWIHIHLWS